MRCVISAAASSTHLTYIITVGRNLQNFMGFKEFFKKKLACFYQ